MGASGTVVCRCESAEVRPISPVVNMFRLDKDEVDLDDDGASFPHSETKGWTKLLQDIPPFIHQKLENKMVNNSRTMPDTVAPKARRNMKKGYGLWKEGYVNNVQDKANIQYQKSGEVEYAKCTCKAGQGGCCKHVAALLYTLLDFINLSLSMIPENLTCTQVAQKWSIPSGCRKTLNKAVKFDELLFRKAQYNKINTKIHSSTIREKYCSTPPNAQTVTKDDIQSMANVLREAERASVLCDTIESNNYEPCDMFETSCAKGKRTKSKLDLETVDPNTDKLLVDKIFTSVPCEFDQTVKLGSDEKKQMETLVLVTPDQAKDICLKTIDQSSSAQWYVERSVRI
ncbi:ATP-dependent DNA helicase PIF1 [Paramuricea clavata]|uniref:ATP-dependent DNA helicase PIF1 n=1 Tax=Paramuricea clavata TaxID=317549 RepID=A0A7D9JNW9_PARCT|nr:ATP-dependent DNA helicase PIF1 [Paramuricea clavata]